MAETKRAGKGKARRRPDLPTSRGAFGRHCRGCGLVVLEGLSEERCGWLVQTDCQALTHTLEQAALILGRRTFRVWNRPGQHGILLARRDAFHLRTRADPAAGVVIVAEHLCGTILRSPAGLIPSMRVSVSSFGDDDAPPPF